MEVQSLGDDIVGIVAVDVLIPIVIQERHTFLMLPHALTPVSYTHLDVYKRQWLQPCLAFAIE